VVRNLESNGERNRALYVLKARGLRHSNQVREFVISSKGLDLVDVYLSETGEMLVGSARLARVARDADAILTEKDEAEMRRLDLERQRKAVEGQIATLRADLDAKEKEARVQLSTQQQRDAGVLRARQAMAHQRSADNLNDQ